LFLWRLTPSNSQLALTSWHLAVEACAQCQRPSMRRNGSLLLSARLGNHAGHEFPVFFGELALPEQLRPVAQRFLQRSLPAPAADLVVVSAQQHLGDLHPA